MFNQKEYCKKWNDTHKEQIKKYTKIYYDKNKEELLKERKMWKLNNPDKCRKYRNKWKKKNHSEVNRQAKEYRKKHPIKTKARNIANYKRFKREYCLMCLLNEEKEKAIDFHHIDYESDLGFSVCQSHHTIVDMWLF